MYYLYLDESGDLGHYTESPGASKYFVITVLEVANDKDKKVIEKAVERTLKNKLHKKRSLQTSSITELKAVIKALPLETASTRMTFVLDKRMGSAAMHEFNELLRLQIQSQIPPQVPLFIDHENSNKIRLLQAVDLFSWGIYRKYEMGDTEWYDLFHEKIKFERIYPDK